MATITLTLPLSGTGVTAGLHSTNYSSIQAAVNALDNTNIAVGANIDPLKLASGFQTYLPALSASGGGSAIGNGSTSGRFVQIGKLVHAQMSLTQGTTTGFGTGNLQISLPVTASAAVVGSLGVAIAVISGSTYTGFVEIVNTTTIVVLTPASPAVVWSGSTPSPATWVAGSTLYLRVSYEAA